VRARNLRRHSSLVLSSLAGVLILAGCGSRPQARERAGADAAIAASILRFQREITDAWLKHDVAAVDRFFAEDFRSVTTSGRILGKSDILAAVAGNDETGTDLLDEEVRVVAPGVVLYTARIVDHGLRAGTREPYSVTTRVLNVWIRRKGRWQIVADQTIHLKPAP
jgi:ketosteroid isomerase-like protein